MKFRYYWLITMAVSLLGFAMVYGFFAGIAWMHDHVWQNLSETTKNWSLGIVVFLIVTLGWSAIVWAVEESE